MAVIVKGKTGMFLEEAIPKLQELPTHTYRCHCGEYIQFPIIVAQEDYIAFCKLLHLAAKYLQEKGVTDAMLDDIRKKINERINIQ